MSELKASRRKSKVACHGDLPLPDARPTPPTTVFACGAGTDNSRGAYAPRFVVPL